MTIIETKNKTLLFIHVPKTGGVSICGYFGALTSGHAPLSSFNPDLMQYYFKFAFVRDPYTRVVSCYEYLKNGGMNCKDKLDFERYCEPYGCFGQFIVKGLSYASTHQQHFIPQTYYTGSGGSTPQLDFIGKFENINNDFNKLLTIIGMGKTNFLPKKNSSGTEVYALTKMQKEIIYGIYREDFENFGYKK
jgi:hypothetical protein